MPTLAVDGTYWWLFAGMVPMAVGLGWTFVPFTLIATTNVEDDEAGLASGIFNTSQQIGGAIGLAILSTVGGFLNVEEEVPVVGWFNFDGEGGALHRWLHPVLAGSEDVIRASGVPLAEVHHSPLPIILAIAIGLGGLALAFLVVGARNKRLRTADTEPAYRGTLQKWLYNKWFVDELYDLAVVRTVNRASRAQWGFDRIIDGTVDFFGRMAQALGLWVGRAQTGFVNTYAFVLIVGVLVVLGSFVAF